MIYFPMTANILTPGHIKCLVSLCSSDDVVIGLLNAKALEGYKKEVVPFEDRKYILNSLNIRNFIIAEQDSLDPTENINKFKCTAIASGDGWEEKELQSIKKLGLKIINIKLKGEETKKYSSSKILKI